MHSRPSASPSGVGPSSTLPSAPTSTGHTPGSGSVAEPGFCATAPGRGAIMMPPVSVCHQLSTSGQRPPPTVPWNHSHASGLIGSPTEPSTRRLSQELAASTAGSSRISARIAVGAV